MRQEWVAIVEAMCISTPFDSSAFQRLLQVLDDCSPVALYAPDRFALQLHVTAEDTLEAFSLALRRWNAALGQLPHLRWSVVRAEVMTSEEFHLECEVAARNKDVPPPPRQQEQAGDHLAGSDLLRLAFEDPLTGMETASVFAYRLDEAAARGHCVADTTAVVVLDLDEFGAFNERHGTRAGDRLLAAVAERLLWVLGGVGNPARVGGDRFAVLLEEASDETAVSSAERLLDALRTPFDLEGGQVGVRASVGVAVGLRSEAPSLMENATTALLAAKILKRGGLQVFRPGCELELEGSHADTDQKPQLGECLFMLRRAAAAGAESAGVLEAAGRVLPEVCEYAGWSLAHLCVVDPAGGFSPTPVWYSSDAVRFRAIHDALATNPAPLEVGLLTRMAAERRPQWASVLDGLFPEDRAAAGLKGLVVVPVLAGTQIVASLQGFVEDTGEPDLALLETLALVGMHLGQAHRANGHIPGTGDAHRPTVAPTRSAPLRYELFGWEPDQPAPGLDTFLPRPGCGAVAGNDLYQALTSTYERLAAALADRSVAAAADPTPRL